MIDKQNSRTTFSTNEKRIFLFKIGTGYMNLLQLLIIIIIGSILCLHCKSVVAGQVITLVLVKIMKTALIYCKNVQFQKISILPSRKVFVLHPLPPPPPKEIPVKLHTLLLKF